MSVQLQDPTRKHGNSTSLDFAALERILPRYVGPGPRYTSYPTVPAWQGDFGATDHRDALRSLSPEREVSLYAHVPFCASLCHFCACNRVITKDLELPERYLRAIEREVEIVRSETPDGLDCGQLHWGGGTPTHLTPAQIERLFRLMTDRFPLRDDAEISIEVDPRVTTLDQLDVLASCGFNRISLGVQDTNPKTQAAIHRIQPFEQTHSLTDAARARGINGVNYDLIYGLPHQTVDSFESTLDDVLTARPDRIALYGYAHVTWVAKQQRGFERGDLPEPERRMKIFLAAMRRLLDAGYRAIGMDHFALPGDELCEALDAGTLRRNFMGYTTREGNELIGFGPSAISEFEETYAQVEKDLDDWFAAAEGGRFATMKGHRLSPDDRARRWIIGRIMCEAGVTAHEVEARFGGTFRKDYARAFERLEGLEEDGLVEISDRGDVHVTTLGRVFLRNVAMAFDAYFDPEASPAEKTFSQTV